MTVPASFGRRGSRLGAEAKNVPVEEVVAGSIVVGHVKRGTVTVIPAGTRLTDFLIERIKKFGVKEVEISVEAEETAALQAHRARLVVEG